ADVLHGVVRIDVQIALRVDLEIEHGVARYLVEHMLEERQPGRQLRVAAAVQVHFDADLGLLRVAGDFGGTHRQSASFSALSSIRFSSGVPTVTRRQLARPGWRLRTSTPRRASAS